MEKLKITEILRTFSIKEIKEFEKFIKSPFFSKGRDVSEIFSVIKKQYPAFTGKGINREVIYGKLYPGKPYKDHIMRNNISVLSKMLAEYLTISRLRKSKVESKKLYIDELLERRLSRPAELELIKAEKELRRNNDSGDNYYRKSFEIENQKVILNVQANRQNQISSSILKQGELLVNNFLEDAGVNYINMLNNAANFNLDFSSSFLGEFLKNINLENFLNDMKNIREIFENTELFEIYACIILTLINKDDTQNYYRLKDLLIKNLKRFNRMEKYSLLVTLGTCTSLKAETVSRDIFIRELFEIYRIRLSSRLYAYSDSQHMSNIFFLSTMKLGISLGEVKWTRDFINDNINNLAENQREKMKNYAYAQMSFHEGEFMEALNYLTRVDFELYTMKYEVRNLMAQIYYELDEPEQIIYLSDSYRHFLYKNKTVSKYFKEVNLEFIDILNDLVRYKLSGTAKLHGEISARINSSRTVQKNWFLKKLEELQKK